MMYPTCFRLYPAVVLANLLKRPHERRYGVHIHYRLHLRLGLACQVPQRVRRSRPDHRGGSRAVQYPDEHLRRPPLQQHPNLPPAGGECDLADDRERVEAELVHVGRQALPQLRGRRAVVNVLVLQHLERSLVVQHHRERQPHDVWDAVQLQHHVHARALLADAHQRVAGLRQHAAVPGVHEDAPHVRNSLPTHRCGAPLRRRVRPTAPLAREPGQQHPREQDVAKVHRLKAVVPRGRIPQRALGEFARQLHHRHDVPERRQRRHPHLLHRPFRAPPACVLHEPQEAAQRRAGEQRAVHVHWEARGHRQQQLGALAFDCVVSFKCSLCQRPRDVALQRFSRDQLVRVFTLQNLARGHSAAGAAVVRLHRLPQHGQRLLLGW
ncbi:uncharacterized protein BcabD6B2_38400 [Babesia caballi]|uniref:Uncharacterized protein n=1 Tax=Babesia caballi TaxID=5871 RepID=A0AAV4LWX5_BABCB|nr:hypothetical protein, conserved [Babesia caballi]